MPYFLTSHRDFINPAEIYYEDIGLSDRPIIVMQHGDGNDSQNWKTLGYVEKLSNYRLILIDYLGYGKSDKIYDPKAYAMPLLAADTIALLKHLKLTQPVIFFGGSMGARLGYELAVTPDYASFFDAFILNGMGSEEVSFITQFKKWAETGNMENVVNEMELFMATPFPDAVRTTFLKNDPKAYAAANTYPWPSITDKLKFIDKPTLLICGELADEFIQMENDCKLIPQAEIQILTRLDHAQAYWYSDAVVPVMLSFIERLELI